MSRNKVSAYIALMYMCLSITDGLLTYVFKILMPIPTLLHYILSVPIGLALVSGINIEIPIGLLVLTIEYIVVWKSIYFIWYLFSPFDNY